MKSGYAFAGTNAYLATKITTVKEVFQDLSDGFRSAMNLASPPEKL